MIVYTGIFFKLGFMIGISLMLGWWPSTTVGRISTLIGLSLFSWIVAVTNSSAYVGIIATCVFVLPAIITMSIKVFMDKLNQLADEEEQEELRQLCLTKKPIEIVQAIDNSLNCIVGVNNLWVQNNWSKLTDDEKVNFVNLHREVLNEELPQAENAGDIIQLLQKLSRGLADCA